MNKMIRNQWSIGVLLAVALLWLLSGNAMAGATVPGISGPAFSLHAGQANIDTPDGDSLLIWAYGNTGAPVQYVGPTLIVNQNDAVTVTLTNNLNVNTSIVFPGHMATASGGVPGEFTTEAAAGGGTVTYSFTASNPGTYTYHSGTQPDLQVEMGLVGALIVRPTGYDPNAPTAYGPGTNSEYVHEYLFVFSEMDPDFHKLVEFGFIEQVDMSDRFAVLWYINGRNGLDTVSPDNLPWSPHQPYGALARTHPGEKVLIRMVGGGHDPHPFHTHGNHAELIAQDGRPKGVTEKGDFTIEVYPGATYDAIFSWTSKDLGWDVYGAPLSEYPHDCTPSGPENIDANTGEDCDFHGVEIPVTLPGLQDLAFGGWYSGSPFLGQFGDLPVGEGGLNLDGGLFFMWHSHDEKELTNNDIFPGGMLTMVIIEHPDVPIP
jgi:hypothetical protein